ncbi:hypothetical protein [Streptomyces sp. NPDC021356]|uniref:hypothetical protein n=1 Tax=Streptomyces sp. NPDC021356 TaxID=3154900 RepID=UPI0033CB2B7C
MIFSNPIGDWNWEVASGVERLRPIRAAETAVVIWKILEEYDLAVGNGKVDLSARAMSDTRNTLFRAEGLPLEAEPLSPGTALSHAVSEIESTVGDLIISARAECPGYWLESGVKHRAEKLFSVQVEIWRCSLLLVTLETYSDAWLTMDTRDREQPEVYAQNAPRLSAVLHNISAFLGSPCTPGDPNRYATPTDSGFEDPRIEGFAYDDSWGTFEVPARSRLLRSRIPESENEYQEITDHPVRYFTIGWDGKTLGYLWASVGDEAAGYEPRTAAGEAALEAGALWLLRLRDAHEQGLSAQTALLRLAMSPSPAETGRAMEEVPREAPSLDALEELSGRY